MLIYSSVELRFWDNLCLVYSTLPGQSDEGKASILLILSVELRYMYVLYVNSVVLICVAFKNKKGTTFKAHQQPFTTALNYDGVDLHTFTVQQIVWLYEVKTWTILGK